MRLALGLVFSCLIWSAALGAGQLPSPNWQPGTVQRNLGYTPMNGANNLSEVTNAAQARVNLGILTSTLTTDSVANHGASGNATTTVGSITAGSSSLTVTSAASFAVGNGIRILGAGATNTVAAASVSGSSVVGTAGTTTYTYYIASLGYNGSMSPYVSVSVATGPNALTYNGLTYYGSTQNYVQVNLVQGANSSGWVVYRGINGATPTLWTVGSGTVFKDQGVGWTSNGTASGSWVGPDYLPASAPTSAVNDWLVTTVSSIASNVITLAATATNSVSSVTVYHDDTAAFNAAASAPANASGANIAVPCGTYYVSSAIVVNSNYIGFSGSGMCSTIIESGTGYDFSFPNSNTSSLQRGNFIRDIYIIDRYKSTGYVVNATNTYNIFFQDITIDFPAFGFNFLNNNLINLVNVVGNNGTRGVSSSWMHFASDSTNYLCCINAFNVYAHGNGVYTEGTTSIGGTDKIGYAFDGNVATAYAVGMAVSNIEGVGFQIWNDTGNSAPPSYLQFLFASTEFANSRSVNIFGPGGGTGPGDVYFFNPTITAALNNNANVVIDSLSARIQFDGGKIANAGCRGVEIGGTSVSLTGGIFIGNNSTPAAGGTAGSCPGVVLDASARGTVISGAQIGDPFNATAQSVPVQITNGADYFSVVGNDFYGNVTNCVSNGTTAGTSRIVASNAGSC